MKRSYLFRKPIDVNNDDDEFLNIRESNRKIIHAKPIKEKYVKKLGSLGVGKDFVIGSRNSQKDFQGSGIQLIEEKSEECRSLSFDERNKLSAKILKAELKGDLDLVKKLKAKLEGSSAENLLQSEKSEILLRTNEKSGLTMPVFKKAKCDDTDHSSEKTKYKLGDVEAKYHSQMELNEMRKEEKYTNASDQLYLFSQSAKAACSSRTDDDWVIDDAMMSQKKKRKFAEKEQKREHEKAIRDHKSHEIALVSCNFCIDSPRFLKYGIIAIGIKTYLACVSWKPLVEGHCMIVPICHYSSTTHLDEDVYDEMRIWRKGLVAMWKAQNMDCVFIEMANNVKNRGHMFIECIPLPVDIGEMIPIYFKKAIDEAETEWSNNKKLIDLNKKGGDLRKAVPKGFPYFAVDFGLHAGYAHVIENVDRFPKNFAYEIIGGILDLDFGLSRKKENLKGEQLNRNCEHMKELWLPYDWTEKVKKSLANQ